MRQAAALLCLLAAPALALDLPAPARLSAEGGGSDGTLAIATGPWTESGVPMREVTGTIRHEAWLLPDTSLTPRQMLDPLEAQLAADGFEPVFTCRDRECGGFDFRYALELLPEPGMHVDLGNYLYLATMRPDGAAVALTASRGGGAGYIHISRAGPDIPEVSAVPPPDPPEPDATTADPDPLPDESIAALMARNGHVVLNDLEFSTGASELSSIAFPSLIELAAWLNADPGRRVVLVGHSDAVGALDTNVTLSRQRAEAVAERLQNAHGVAEGQISAEGVGYLAPIATNATPEGRAANRRVDAVSLGE